MPDPIEPDPDPIEPSHNYLDRFIDLNTADLVTDVVTASDGERSIRVRRRGWQRDPPEEDGWYIVALDFPHRQTDAAALHVVYLGPLWSTGRRAAASQSDGLVDEIEDVSWWLVPALDLPPIPESED